MASPSLLRRRHILPLRNRCQSNGAGIRHLSPERENGVGDVERSCRKSFCGAASASFVSALPGAFRVALDAHARWTVHGLCGTLTAMPAYTVDALVELLQLAPHPEGGYYRETFRSTDRVQRVGSPATAPRSAGTAIYFLLPAGTFSAWHRVQSDEAWHHYDGAPLDLHTRSEE